MTGAPIGPTEPIGLATSVAAGEVTVGVGVVLVVVVVLGVVVGAVVVVVVAEF